MTWTVGMTSMSRPYDTISQINKAGWSEVIVFADEGASGYLTEVRPFRYGSWANWICSWFEMYMTHSSDMYVLFEDDIILCRNIKLYLEQKIPLLGNFGAISLYTPARQHSSYTFHDEAWRGWQMWGTQAIIFSRASLKRFLTSEIVMTWRESEYGKDNRHRDSALGLWGEKVFYHSPSLCEHIGKSTLGSEGHRSLDFVGEDFDALSLTKTSIFKVIQLL